MGIGEQAVIFGCWLNRDRFNKAVLVPLQDKRQNRSKWDICVLPQRPSTFSQSLRFKPLIIKDVSGVRCPVSMGSLPSPLLVLGPQNTVVIHTLACQYGNVPLAIPLPSLIPLRTNEFPHYCHFCGPTHQASLVKFSNFRTFCKMSTHDLPTHGYIYGYTLLPYWLTRWHLPILPLPLTTHYSSHFRHVWFLHSKVLSAYTMPSSSFYFSSSSRIVVLFVSKPLPHPTPNGKRSVIFNILKYNYFSFAFCWRGVYQWHSKEGMWKTFYTK